MLNSLVKWRKYAHPCRKLEQTRRQTPMVSSRSIWSFQYVLKLQNSARSLKADSSLPFAANAHMAKFQVKSVCRACMPKGQINSKHAACCIAILQNFFFFCSIFFLPPRSRQKRPGQSRPADSNSAKATACRPADCVLFCYAARSCRPVYELFMFASIQAICLSQSCIHSPNSEFSSLAYL